MPALSSLDALLLDAGNTVVFLDMEAVAEVAHEEGVSVDPARLSSVEGDAKRDYEQLLAGGGGHESGWRAVFDDAPREGGRRSAAAPRR